MKVCRNCGKQVNDNNKFCPMCGCAEFDFENAGMPNTPYSAQQSNYAFNGGTAVQQRTAQKKRGLKWWAILLIVVASIGAMTAIGFIFSDINSKPAEPNPEYLEVFSSHSIAHLPNLTAPEKACFVKVNGDNQILCQDIGYNGDRISEMIQTFYTPVDTSDLSDSDIELLKEKLASNLVRYKAYDFCKTNVEIIDNYSVITITVSDMDNKKNYPSMKLLGIIDNANNTGFISLSKSAQSLIDEGYIRK